MWRKHGFLFVTLLAALFLLQMRSFAAGGEEAARMTKEELKTLLGSNDLVLLDVRHDGKAAPSRIIGAVHEDPERVDSWAGKYSREKRIVLYCS